MDRTGISLGRRLLRLTKDRYPFILTGMAFTLTGLLVLWIFIMCSLDPYNAGEDPPPWYSTALLLALTPTGIFTFFRRGIACAMAVLLCCCGLFMCFRWALFEAKTREASDWSVVVLAVLFGLFVVVLLPRRIREWRWP